MNKVGITRRFAICGAFFALILAMMLVTRELLLSQQSRNVIMWNSDTVALNARFAGLLDARRCAWAKIIEPATESPGPSPAVVVGWAYLTPSGCQAMACYSRTEALLAVEALDRATAMGLKIPENSGTWSRSSQLESLVSAKTSNANPIIAWNEKAGLVVFVARVN